MKYFIFLITLFIIPAISYSYESLENLKPQTTRSEIVSTFHGVTLLKNGTLWDKEMGVKGQKVYFQNPPEVVGEIYTYVLKNNDFDEEQSSDNAKLIYQGRASEYEPTDQVTGTYDTAIVRDVISITPKLELIDIGFGYFIYVPILHSGIKKGDGLTITGTTNSKNAYLIRIIDEEGTKFTTPMLRISDNYYVIP